MKGTATATLKNLRMGPRKVRLVVDLIRGQRVPDALSQLQFSKKHASRAVAKLLESAIANAVHNNHLKQETLYISEAFVDGGAVLHRWMPRAMGRATPLRKRSSHITLVLSGEVDAAAAKKEEETETVAAEAINTKTPKKKVIK